MVYTKFRRGLFYCKPLNPLNIIKARPRRLRLKNKWIDSFNSYDLRIKYVWILETKIHVFATSLLEEADVKRVAPLLNACRRVVCWNVDLEDEDRVLRVECQDMTSREVVSLLEAEGYVCRELKYLPTEMPPHHCRPLRLFFFLLGGLCFLAASARGVRSTAELLGVGQGPAPFFQVGVSYAL